MTDYTSAEFWAGAPEGAQGFMPGGKFWVEGFWKIEHGDKLFCHNGNTEWKKSHAYPFDQAEFIPRPTTQPAAWNGPEDGLPPLGLVCQVQSEDGDWHECIVLAHHLHNAVFAPHADYPYGVYDGLPVERFRPIRTPEQVAAAEREAAIKEMSEVIKSQFSFGWVFEKLYDAGYRKQDESK